MSKVSRHSLRMMRMQGSWTWGRRQQLDGGSFIKWDDLCITNIMQQHVIQRENGWRTPSSGSQHYTQSPPVRRPPLKEEHQPSLPSSSQQMYLKQKKWEFSMPSSPSLLLSMNFKCLLRVCRMLPVRTWNWAAKRGVGVGVNKSFQMSQMTLEQLKSSLIHKKCVYE